MSRRSPSLREFIALIALLFSMVAFAIDSMLPSLPEISAELGLANVNRAQLVIIVFVFGTGFGQLLAGPLSDSFGRKPVITIGLGIFLLASLWAFLASSFESLLMARFVQGLGIAAPRTVTHAMVRDLHSGRHMARVVSFAMMLFVLVPAVAPYIGQTIMLAFGWRYIFVAFQIGALIAITWLAVRQPETLPPDKRTPFRGKVIVSACREVFTNRKVVTCTLGMTLGYTCIFAYLVSAQQVYVVWLDAGYDFPLYFALTAILAGGASFLNAVLVMRLGMLWLATFGYLAIFLLSIAFGVVILSETFGLPTLLWLFVGWSTAMFFLLGLCLANQNALALEPMGHIAGMASAIVGSAASLLCVVFAIPIGQLFDGTGLPLVTGVGICSVAALGLNLSIWRQTVSNVTVMETPPESGPSRLQQPGQDLGKQ
ncbi:MAG: multidrug effflux MFS transporter [Paracoccaceae bacterium]|nr:multidrug effflux MFS transporter [Paracoccaceae bacterium]